MVSIVKLKRRFQEATRCKAVNEFYSDLREGFREREYAPSEFSIREVFSEFVDGGREIVESWRTRGGMQIHEANTAVNSAAFSNITGQIFYNAMLDAMQDEAFVFGNAIRTIQTEFDGEKIPGIGKIGNMAEIVNEGQPYPTVGVQEDWIRTPSTVKRGLIVPVTREAVLFDRTGQLLDRCREVGEVLGLSKEIRVIDAIIDANTTAHRYNWKDTVYATYQASTPWVNVKTSNALVDWTDIEGSELILAAITDPNTGLPVVNTAKDLVVPPSVKYTAAMIVTQTQITRTTPGFATSANPTQQMAANPVSPLRVLSSQLFLSRCTAGSVTAGTWYHGDLMRAFAYMQNWGIETTMRGGESEAAFERDVIQQYKASERGAMATMDPRRICRNTP